MQTTEISMIDLKREAVINQINSDDFVLSFSGIKEFAKSPAHFIAYKMGDKVTTPAMKKGSLIHCAILEPEALETRYAILNRADLPEPDSDFRNTENKKFKAAFEAKAKEQGKELIDPSEWESAIQHRDLAYNNEVVSPYLRRLRKKEQYTEWEFAGFKWRGVRDGLGDTFILDLKTVDDASPEWLRTKAKREKYHWQQFLYKQGEDVAPYFDSFNLLVDGSMGIALLKIEWSLLSRAEAELIKVLDAFKMCREQNMWHMNYEFWTEGKGYFSID